MRCIRAGSADFPSTLLSPRFALWVGAAASTLASLLGHTSRKVEPSGRHLGGWRRHTICTTWHVFIGTAPETPRSREKRADARQCWWPRTVGGIDHAHG